MSFAELLPACYITVRFDRQGALRSKGDDLGFAFANILGVDPFAAKIGIDVAVQFGVDAHVNIHGTIFFVGGFVMGAIGQVDNASGLERGLDLHVQFRQDRQHAAAALGWWRR